MPRLPAMVADLPPDPGLDGAADEVVRRILDAAAEEFSRHGVRRTSMDDVARRAKVGRNTVFRRMGSKDELIRAVLGRELLRLLADLDRVVADADGPVERVSNAFATTVRTLRSHPIRGISVDENPEEAAELAAFGGGEFMRLSTDYVVGVLSADRDRGALAADLDVEVVAETVVRLIHSILLVPHLNRPLEAEADLRAFAVAALGPHLR